MFHSLGVLCRAYRDVQKEEGVHVGQVTSWRGSAQQQGTVYTGGVREEDYNCVSRKRKVCPLGGSSHMLGVLQKL